jgi:hypothetical protein
LLDTSCGKWYVQKEAENWLSKYTLCIRPVPHGKELPVREPPKEYNLTSEMEEEDIEKRTS